MISDIRKVNELVVIVSNAISELRELKRNNPELKLGYVNSYGGVLNAYREGDLTFKEAISELENIAKNKIDDSSEEHY